MGQSDNEPQWNGGARQKKARKYLWNAIKHAYPEQLASQLRQGIEQGMFTADEAMVFPLTGAMDKPLASLAHRHEQWPDHTRDTRMVAWFEAARQADGVPGFAIALLHGRSNGAMVRLMKMKAFECLDWWRDKGVESQLRWPDCAARERINLATLAFINGQVGYLDRVMGQGEALEQPERLWPKIWSKPCMAQSHTLLERLMSAHGAPPYGVMAWWASAWVNNGNIDAVIASGQRLIDAGAHPNHVPEGAVPAIGVATQRLISPSSLKMVQFLLEHGADPMTEFDMGEVGAVRRTCALELALDGWIKASPSSMLRPTAREVFLAVARHAPRGAMAERYPADRRAALTEQLRGGAEDVAALDRVWLEHGVAEPEPVPAASRPRL